MKTRLSRWSAIIALVSVLALLLAACGAPASTTQPSPSPAATGAPEAERAPAASPTTENAPAATPAAEATPAATPDADSSPAATDTGEVVGVQPQGDGNLSLWVAGNSPDIQQAFNTVIATFEQNNPGFKVDVQFVPWGDLSTKLTTAFAGNVGPDLFMHGVAASAGFMDRDQIEDLTPYFEQLPDKEDFLPNLIEGAMVDGKLAMMPVQVTNYMLIYRKDLYQEAGLDPDNPPTTWEELIEVSKQLTQSDAAGITRAGLQMPSDDPANVALQYAPLLRTEGGELLTPDGKQAAFNSEAGVRALQRYVDLFHTHKVASLVELPGDPQVSAIGRGAAAQIISGQFELASVKQADPAVYEQIGVALPPAGASGQPVTMSSFSGFMMNKNARNKADAWTLMRHIVSPSSLTVIDSTSLFLPPRESLQSADFVTSDPLFQAFADNLQYGRGNPNVPQWVEVRNTLAEHLIAAINQQMTPEAALAAAEQRVNEVLNK